MLSKIAYRQLLKELDRIRSQDEEDRKENPHLLPCSWGNSIRSAIRGVCRSNHERCSDTLIQDTLDCLCQKGILVKYCGDYTFPGKELPTDQELKAEALRNLRKMNQS